MKKGLIIFGRNSETLAIVMGPKHAPLGRRLLNFDMERQFVFMAAMATDRPLRTPSAAEKGPFIHDVIIFYGWGWSVGSQSCEKIDGAKRMKT